MNSLERPLQVVIVDDNYPDVRWMQEALSGLRLNCMVTILTDGAQAIDFLLKRGPYLIAPDPDIVFLDINLPKRTGIEVLEEVQGEREYPVCVVSGSKLEQDVVRRRFKLDARCYAVKPVDYEAILKAFECFDHLKPIAEQIRNSGSAPDAY